MADSNEVVIEGEILESHFDDFVSADGMESFSNSLASALSTVTSGGEEQAVVFSLEPVQMIFKVSFAENKDSSDVVYRNFGLRDYVLLFTDDYPGDEQKWNESVSLTLLSEVKLAADLVGCESVILICIPKEDGPYYFGFQRSNQIETTFCTSRSFRVDKKYCYLDGISATFKKLIHVLPDVHLRVSTTLEYRIPYDMGVDAFRLFVHFPERDERSITDSEVLSDFSLVASEDWSLAADFSDTPQFFSYILSAFESLSRNRNQEFAGRQVNFYLDVTRLEFNLGMHSNGRTLAAAVRQLFIDRDDFALNLSEYPHLQSFAQPSFVFSFVRELFAELDIDDSEERLLLVLSKLWLAFIDEIEHRWKSQKELPDIGASDKVADHLVFQCLHYIATCLKTDNDYAQQLIIEEDEFQDAEQEAVPIGFLKNLSIENEDDFYEPVYPPLPPILDQRVEVDFLKRHYTGKLRAFKAANPRAGFDAFSAFVLRAEESDFPVDLMDWQDLWNSTEAAPFRFSTYFGEKPCADQVASIFGYLKSVRCSELVSVLLPIMSLHSLAVVNENPAFFHYPGIDQDKADFLKLLDGAVSGHEHDKLPAAIQVLHGFELFSSRYHDLVEFVSSFSSQSKDIEFATQLLKSFATDDANAERRFLVPRTQESGWRSFLRKQVSALAQSATDESDSLPPPYAKTFDLHCTISSPDDPSLKLSQKLRAVICEPEQLPSLELYVVLSSALNHPVA